MVPVPAPVEVPGGDEGTDDSPSDEAQVNCTVGEWGQCGGPGHEGKCCTGGLPCQRQSEWYSQCRIGCPSGWECENEPVPAPVDPTPSPVDPTPGPVDPVPAPVDDETE